MARASLVFVLVVATTGICACGASAPGGAASPAQARETAATEPRAEAKPPSGPPTAVDCGDFATCAVAAGGEVRCWGRDAAGELGDGGGADRAKSVPVAGVEGATKIAAGSQFACALVANGRVKCWGTGQIANDGKAVANVRATDVSGVEGAVELAASGVLACARTASEVKCWGGDDATTAAAPKGKFTELAVGVTHACALDERGAVTCWGSGDWGAKGAFAKPGVTSALHLATGDRHACVVAKDKRVLCWGQNDAGQLGTKPDANAHKKPAPVPSVTNAVGVVAGEESSCAILADGSARCWGANGEGELGLGRASSDERPAKIGVDGVAGLCIATTHACALTKSGAVLCWGANAHGQLGDGTKTTRLAPSPIAW